MSYNSSLVCLLTLTVILLCAGLYLYEKYKQSLRLKLPVVTGCFFGVSGGLLLVHAILYWPGAQEQIYGELACLSGCSLGWLIGMWLSPMGTTESTKFAKYWTAVGVGSGFTIKWAMDRVVAHAGWFAAHAFISVLFAVALVVTTAAVYNSRAYNDSLTIAPRQPLLDGTTISGGAIRVQAGKHAALYAAVVGPNDPLTRWAVFPAELGSVGDDGIFHAGDTPGRGRISAFNVEDPTLSGCIEVVVSSS